MNILFVITKSNWGGAQRYVFDMATGLARNGHTVTVAAGGSGGPGQTPGLLFEKLADSGIRTIHIRHFTRDLYFLKDLSAFFELKRLIASERPDVVHLNSSKAGGMGALAARLAGIKKIVFTAHGFAFFEKRSMLQKFLIRIATWVTLLLATKVICLGQRERDAVASWPLVGHKLSIIPLGIAPTTPLSRADARDALGIAQDTSFVIGVIGELTANKNIDVLLTAVDDPSLAASQLIIIGAGECAEELRAQAAGLGMSERVIFTGFLPGADQYIRALDVLVLPSQKEGFPYVLLEAGMAGVPVVASAVGAIPEMLADAADALVPPGDVPALVERLCALKDESVRRDLAARIEARIRTAYSLERMVNTTEALYR